MMFLRAEKVSGEMGETHVVFLPGQWVEGNGGRGGGRQNGSPSMTGIRASAYTTPSRAAGQHASPCSTEEADLIPY